MIFGRRAVSATMNEDAVLQCLGAHEIRLKERGRELDVRREGIGIGLARPQLLIDMLARLKCTGKRAGKHEGSTAIANRSLQVLVIFQLKGRPVEKNIQDDYLRTAVTKNFRQPPYMTTSL